LSFYRQVSGRLYSEKIPYILSRNHTRPDVRFALTPPGYIMGRRRLSSAASGVASDAPPESPHRLRQIRRRCRRLLRDGKRSF